MTYNAQPGRGEAHSITVRAMPNEALIVHVPDPEANKVIKVNDIRETRYAKVIAVGEPQGRHRQAPVEVGDVVVMQTATAGIAVPGIHHENKLVHRLEWHLIMAVAEGYANE